MKYLWLGNRAYWWQGLVGVGIDILNEGVT